MNKVDWELIVLEIESKIILELKEATVIETVNTLLDVLDEINTLKINAKRSVENGNNNTPTRAAE